MAGELLEAGLAADQTVRARTRGKWEQRHRWAVGGAQWLHVAVRYVMWVVGTAMGLGIAVAVITGSMDALVMIPFGGGIMLVGLLFLDKVFQSVLAKSAKIIVRAARYENVDLDSAD